jgi:GrpB-like predicted nucleotidyltransferase (UPF0157 family)
MSDVSREPMPADVIVGDYALTAAEYLPYNPESPRVAALIGKIITAANSDVQVEHIGSTAVPGCWGKGIIDLLVLYRSGELELARATLDRLGFQRQPGSDPFPESRPMRVGSVESFGRTYRIHAHVIEAGSADARNLIKFRDMLRADTALRRAYEAEKRAILARGVTKSTDYSKAKGIFIGAVLTAEDL